MSPSPAVNSSEWWEDYFRTKWDANGGGGQTRHFMQRLISELPDIEAAYLRSGAASILDWGCAMGEGVDELAAAFPRARVRGLDIAAAAVTEARRRFPRREFVHAPDGEIDVDADVVVASNCLEHFAEPWPVAARLAQAARELLVVLVPCAEDPLCESHAIRLDEASFPDELGGKRVIARKRLSVDPRHWGGDQLLVIYASPRYIAKRGVAPIADGGEREKWERYYGALVVDGGDDDDVMARFGSEFAAAVLELLPEGGRVLEAGCGGGGHSLALARTGRFEVTLLDFSEQALRHARARFQRAGVRAEFVLADAREPGRPEYDLVFNSGVLEHFAAADQVRLVRGMASRSRRLVLALVPNRDCYWYWVWRIQAASRGDWAFGSEIAAAELASVFAAAGVNVLGERVLGQDWTESFFGYLQGLSPALLSQLLVIHRSPVIAPASKGYLRAAVGSVVGHAASPVPAAWTHADTTASATADALTASLADALALQVRMHADLVRRADQHERMQAELASRELTANSLQQRLDATTRALDEAKAAAEATRCQSAEWDAARARVAAEHADTAARLRTTEERLTGRERELRELQAWRAAVMQSKTFKLMRMWSRLRAKVKPDAPR